MAISQRLAAYIHGLSFESIPDSDREHCKKLILDTIGVAISGSRTSHGSISADFAREFADKKESSVIGHGFKTSSLNAAFANGVMAHAIDFDDTYEPGAVHVGCAVIPAALALGEARKISGRDLITAIVAGYDISCRVAMAIFPQRHPRRGYHTTGMANSFGVAAACGKILDLSEEQLVSAFGLAGDQSSALLQYHFDGTMLKHFHGGKAAQNGLFAALLAQRGFTGSPEIFEGEYGYCNFVSPDDYDLAELDKGLGEDFRVSATSIKPYPSCRATNSPIDAALILRSEHNIEPGEVDKIIVRTYTRAFNSYNKPSPDTVLQSLLSEQYTTATALAKGKVTLDDFTPESIWDKEVRELMGKIELVEDEEMTRIFKEQRNRPHEVQIFMKSGENFVQRILDPQGSPRRPVSDAELASKFRGLVSAALSEAGQEQLMDCILKLEDVADVGELAELI